MEFKVHFVVAAFGQDVDNFTLHIYASIAQQERKMIGERISAAHVRWSSPIRDCKPAFLMDDS
jgi:hypothetical protein